MICVAVTYVIKPGHEDEAIALFAKLTEHTRAEPGCRMYLAHRSTTDPRQVLPLRTIRRPGRARCPSRRAAFRAVCQGGPVPDHREPTAGDLRPADRLMRRMPSTPESTRDQVEDRRRSEPRIATRCHDITGGTEVSARARGEHPAGEHLRVPPRSARLLDAGEARNTAISSGCGWATCDLRASATPNISITSCAPTPTIS